MWKNCRRARRVYGVEIVPSSDQLIKLWLNLCLYFFQTFLTSPPPFPRSLGSFWRALLICLFCCKCAISLQLKISFSLVFILFNSAYHGHITSVMQISPYKFNRSENIDVKKPDFAHVVSIQLITADLLLTTACCVCLTMKSILPHSRAPLLLGTLSRRLSWQVSRRWSSRRRLGGALR